MLSIREANELNERITKSHAELLAALKCVLGAIDFSGWHIDDERWEKPIDTAWVAIANAERWLYKTSPPPMVGEG